MGKEFIPNEAVIVKKTGETATVIEPREKYSMILLKNGDKIIVKNSDIKGFLSNIFSIRRD